MVLPAIHPFFLGTGSAVLSFSFLYPFHSYRRSFREGTNLEDKIYDLVVSLPGKEYEG